MEDGWTLAVSRWAVRLIGTHAREGRELPRREFAAAVGHIRSDERLKRVVQIRRRLCRGGRAAAEESNGNGW